MQVASINKSVNTENEINKKNLAISNCRNSKGEQFWLLHLIDKVTVYNSSPIDIDKLNNDLDILLNS